MGACAPDVGTRSATVARPRLILSVDVEDWPQSVLNAGYPIGDYCADNVRRLLDLFGEHGARGTFFILGKFAARHPDVVRAIGAAGHELGSHGYGHVNLLRLTPAEFRADIGRATALVSDIAGVSPRGHRAPQFSIVGETLWALDVLAESGYVYDSSVFPIERGRYGITGWPTEPVRVRLDNGLDILEFPLTVALAGRRRVPISGGGYARLLPQALLKRLLRGAALRRRIPPVFYCHPYEIDTGEFSRVPYPIPFRVRLHQGLGRRGFVGKLRMLLRQFECLPFAAVLEEARTVRTMAYGAYKLEPGQHAVGRARRRRARLLPILRWPRSRPPGNVSFLRSL